MSTKQPPVKKADKIYRYEVFPINFGLLTEDKQDETIQKFQIFLNSLEQRIRLIIMKSVREIPEVLDAAGQAMVVEVNRFYLESYNDPIDILLDGFGLTSQPVVDIPSKAVIKEMAKTLGLQDGALAQTFAIYKLPSILQEGFLSYIYGVADKIIIDINPMPHDEAVKKMQHQSSIVQGIMALDTEKGRQPKLEIQNRGGMIQSAIGLLVQGRTRLFEVKVNVTVIGKDREDLTAKIKTIRSRLQGRMIFMDSPAYMQYQMFTGAAGKTLVMDTSTLGTLFPFVSADMFEVPSGIFLGLNILTRAPIIYDPMNRQNYNISILGTTGSGKSFASKCVLTRFVGNNPDTAFFIIDPENEYLKTGEALGAQIFEFNPNTELGLDPFKIFAKVSVADLLMTIIKEMPSDLKATFRTLVFNATSMPDLYSRSPPEVRKYLENLVNGPEAFIFRGPAFTFSTKVIFSLKQLMSDELKQIVSLLIFGRLWQLLNDDKFLPPTSEKVVVVDEAWMYSAIPAAASFLNTVSRLGRKRNIRFMTLTQRPSDIFGEVGGQTALRTVIENSATKFLLKQDETSVGVVTETFTLSDVEREYLLGAEPGEGIMITERGHMRIKFMAGSDEEYKLFTTKPSEIEVEGLVKTI
jgi:hypothetical protein